MPLSNDVKWNKIQEIIGLLEAYDNSRWYFYRDTIKPYIFENVEKLAKRDTWILANQIYDVAVDGLEDHYEHDSDDEVCLPYHYSDVIEVIFELSKFTTTDRWKYVTRDKHWKWYDYNNS